MAKQVTGVDFPVVEAARREGDPAELVAASEQARTGLDWQPQYDDLEFIIRTAWQWELKLRQC